MSGVRRHGPLPWESSLGATAQGDGTTRFRVWAPRATTVAVELRGADHSLQETSLGMFEGVLEARPGDDYRYVIDGRLRLPDPCSRAQPGGVRGPSRIIDPRRSSWTDATWPGIAARDLVVYELHVGAFSAEGTFAAVAEQLPDLRELGVTAIELMPVGTFPGTRNWGYDGLYTWAPAEAYGGPEGLARLVDAAHAHGLGVILDVVYNHLGPGSENLEAFGPYLSHRHASLWGTAVNFDGPDCGAVREWAIQNACMWVRDFHIDGLRIDAVHAIIDHGARHVLSEMTERVHATGPAIVIAESDLNDPLTVTSRSDGGWGFDAQWADDFHHALHALLTGEGDGYYADFGTVADLAEATIRPFLYDGRYSSHRGRPHGAPADGIPRRSFVVCAQNHDQVGNRALGDRPPRRVRRLAAMWTLLSPYTPLVFMGEEYGETRPFAFFTDHIDPHIAAASRDGRLTEFSAFAASSGADVPDPQDLTTFTRSRRDPTGGDGALRDLYRRLIALRRTLPDSEPSVEFDEAARWIALRRGDRRIVGNFGDEPVEIPLPVRDIVLATDTGARLVGGGLHLPALAGAVIA